MKFLFFSQSDIAEFSAAGVNTVNLAKALSEAAEEFVFVACHSSQTDGPALLRQYGASALIPCTMLIRSDGGKKRYVEKGKMLLKLMVIFRDVRPQFFYTRDIAAAFLASLAGVSTQLHIHRVPGFFEKSLIYLLCVLPSFKKLLFVSGALQSHVMPNSTFFQGKSSIVSNGFDERKFTDDAPKQETRKKLKISKEKIVVGYFGRIAEGRGLPLIAKLSQRLNQVIFLVGGFGDLVFCSKMKSEMNADNTIFTGHLKPESVPQIMGACDILLMPYEPLVGLPGNGFADGHIIQPLKMFEYMASGKVIISSNLPGIREVLNDRNAILLWSNDLKNWEDAILELIHDVKRRHALGRAARIISERYTNQRVANKILQGFE